MMFDNEFLNNSQSTLTDEATRSIVHLYNIAILGLVSITGIVSNIINMTVFIRMVLKDSMTLELFCLALTDLLVTTIELCIACTYVAVTVCTSCPVDLWALAYVPFAWAVNAGYLISCWITALVAIERCLCVVFPFQVKQMFTRGRCTMAILVIYGVHISIFIPAFVIQKMEWIPLDPDAPYNSSTSSPETWIYTIVFTEATQQVDIALDITTGLFLFMTSQTVLFVCSVWMMYSLQRSSTVRTHTSHSKEKLDNTNKSQLSKQEKRLLRMVLFLSVLHTVCNLPRVSLTVYYHAYPWGSIESQNNMFSLLWATIAFFSSITCSSTFFGYYHLNSRYRHVILKTFSIRKKVDQ